MSLVDYLEKLQKKPRHIKIQIMWVGAIVCMVFIFFVWFSYMNSVIWQGTETIGQADQNNTQALSESWQQLKQDVPTLWQSLGAGIGSIFNSAESGQSNLIPDGQTEPIEKLPVE